MAKWADYLISAVSYDSQKHISKIRQHRDTGAKIEDGEIIDRTTLVDNLKNGKKYMTIFSSNSTWKLGDKINLIHVGRDYSIRTDENRVKFDNLKFLPELE